MKKMQRFDQINVIPFIDIMLVLLVMVLTTATFIKQGIIPVDLPEAKSVEKKEDLKEVTITIDKEGQIFFDKDKVSMTALEMRLNELGGEETIVLSSDKKAQFQHFVNVMELLKRLEHEQLYIVTKE